MFEKFIFTQKQIERYFISAIKDFKIAKNDNPEITFQFCYNSLLKLALAVGAKNNLRVKSRRGHHIALIAKLAELLSNPEIEVIAEDMRAKRNKDLYGGGVIISEKEAQMYFVFIEELIKEVEKYLNFSKLF